MSYGKKSLSGVDKVIILMRTIGKNRAEKILRSLTEDEVRQVSRGMLEAKDFDPQDVYNVLDEFRSAISEDPRFSRAFVSRDYILDKFFNHEEVESQDVSVWENINQVDDQVLADYLKSSYPQAAAVIMSQLKSEQAARVFTILPDEFSADILLRMLNMDQVKSEVIGDIGDTLRHDLLDASTVALVENDMHRTIATIFNRLGSASKLLEMLEEKMPEDAAFIRKKMFTFKDIVRLKDQDIRVVLRHLDRNKLILSLKGMPENFKELFFRNMPERAQRLFRESISDLGAVKLKDVDAAQDLLVDKIRELGAKGEIDLAASSLEEQFVE